MDKVLAQWLSFAKVDADYCGHKRDVEVVKVPRRFFKMSNRRQKKALVKLPKTVYYNCYPTSVSPLAVDTNTGLINVSVTFDYDTSQFRPYAE